MQVFKINWYFCNLVSAFLYFHTWSFQNEYDLDFVTCEASIYAKIPGLVPNPQKLSETKYVNEGVLPLPRGPVVT